MRLRVHLGIRHMGKLPTWRNVPDTSGKSSVDGISGHGYPKFLGLSEKGASAISVTRDNGYQWIQPL